MVESEDQCQLRSKRKAITAFLPYAIRQERSGRPWMLETFLHAARASKERRFAWRRIGGSTLALISEASPRAIVLVSPHVPWDGLTDKRDLVQRWATATSTVPYSEEVCQSIVDTLLQIASVEKLLPHVDVALWSWLNKRPLLPPVCFGRFVGSRPHVLKAVHALKDVEILKSYLFLVWSEWDTPWSEGFDEVCASIKQNFCGIEMAPHRAELVQRLDHVLEQLDRGLEHIRQHDLRLGRLDLWWRKRQYKKLREGLLEAERRTSSPSDHSFPGTDSGGNTWVLVRRLCSLILSLHSFSGTCGALALDRPPWPPRLYRLWSLPYTSHGILTLFSPDWRKIGMLFIAPTLMGGSGPSVAFRSARTCDFASRLSS